MTFSLASFADVATARVEQIANATHYVGTIPQTPPSVDADDPRVLPYTVLWVTPGANGDEQALAGGVQDDTVVRFTITCAAGDVDWAYKLIDLVLGQFNGWEPAIDGQTVGTCRLDFDPGPLQPGTGFLPTRYYLQLPFVLQVGS